MTNQNRRGGRTPPQELTKLTPILPHVRIHQQGATNPKPNHQDRQAFIFKFEHTPANPLGSFPDPETRYWQKSIGTAPLQIAPLFQVDTCDDKATKVRNLLMDPRNEAVSRRRWSEGEKLRRRQLQHWAIFLGTPKESLQSEMEREIYLRRLQNTLQHVPNTYTGALLMRYHPCALHATTTSDEVWNSIPSET